MILLGPDLMINGGFEDDPVDIDPWSKSADQCSAYASTDYPYEGDQHAYFKTFSRSYLLYSLRVESLTTCIRSGEDYKLTTAISSNSLAQFRTYLYTAEEVSGTPPYDVSLDESQYTQYESIQSYHFYTWSFSAISTDIPKLDLYMTDKDMIFLYDAISLRRRVEIPVDYDYESIQTLDRILARGAKGDLRVYTGPGSHRRFNAPVSWVTALDASTINSWWVTGTEIRLIENDDYPNSYHSVRIIGDKQPINQYQRPFYDEYLTGELIMETV